MLTQWKEAIRPYYLKWVYFRLFPKRKPSYFSQCWTYPELPLTELDRAFPRGTLPDILFLPMTDWHTRLQRTQHLARGFAERGHRCWVVSPHLGREFPAPPVRSTGVCVNYLAPRIAEVHIQLRREPVYHHRRLRADESAQVAEVLESVLVAAGTHRLVEIVSFPLWLDAAVRLAHRFKAPLVYDCHDVLAGFSNVAPELVEDEEALFTAADRVLFSSAALRDDAVEQMPALAERSVVVRNGVDLAALHPEGNPPARKLSEKPVIGYVGALDWWFDTEAVEQAAAAHPEWHFVLVGRVEHAPIALLRRFDNVEFVGEVEHAELYRYFSTFDVALIPFERNPLTMGTNPIKLYEYFSFGLPVVSAKLPEVEAFGGLVLLYETPAEFAGAIERAIAEGREGEQAEQRRDAAVYETWAERVTVIDRALEGVGTR